MRRRMLVRQRTTSDLTVHAGADGVGVVLAHDGETTRLPPDAVARLRIVPGALAVYAADRPGAASA
ncbi:hypothetical protein J1G44_12180 [Cellulomonas sp. zg-ZUI199]|uniref:Uncharacterized protein n=1 Tax=Cellulomonas wangleii TaxID=2816956 RepID=A0ABX8D1C5_9CELL|nr:hypothetical protein [Cellulomonas wangleii]MBO0925234.1 hypothetical protein [Cellulomonas wangleii]QVI61260.1 hypothetical protein KG103_12245 [Cellulomonas wangleii]